MSEATPDAFAAVTGLIALITDPKACAKRIDELRKLIEQAEKAQAQLAAERAAHEAKVAADKAELAAREAKVADRLFRAMRLEKEPPSERPEYFDPFPFDPNLLPGTRGPTGIARHKGDE
jgi:chorismate mutase